MDWNAASCTTAEEFAVGGAEPFACTENETVPDGRLEVADRLKELKLFLGTTVGYQLNDPLTRAQAAAIIVRLLGEEANALQENYSNNPFSDVQDKHWAKNYILYCFENGITKGTSATTYLPERTISSEEFLALAMRLMGYESEPSTALSDCVKTTLFGSDYADRLEGSKEFVRGDAVDIMDKALTTPLNAPEPTLLAEALIENEVFTREQAVEARLLPSEEDNALEQINFIASGKLSQ
ncbi:MAG: S-layer homology domain-containing protein [Clostridiales bacterium]|nr:S-layer homology domain-containing protein [Clostridiales bacterium]